MSNKQKSQIARMAVLDMIYEAQSSHIGSNFSCIDILTVLFENLDFEKDKLVISKGWVAASIYYLLWTKGMITKEELDSFYKPESKFIGLIEPLGKFGLEFAGGSMGYGLPAGVGYALAKKIKNEEGTVYVLMSDGEQAIGTTWESAAIAAHHKLGNLVVMVDYNKHQAMGKTNEILNIETLSDKWEAWNWEVRNINGHKHKEIDLALNERFFPQKPYVILADTIKGKGVSFMENKGIWHYKSPNENEYKQAKQELNVRNRKSTR